MSCFPMCIDPCCNHHVLAHDEEGCIFKNCNCEKKLSEFVSMYGLSAMQRVGYKTESCPPKWRLEWVVRIPSSGEVIGRSRVYSQAVHLQESHNKSVDDEAFKAVIETSPLEGRYG